jgi:alpha-tubulin suppressor-like RCC1 family protein
MVTPLQDENEKEGGVEGEDVMSQETGGSVKGSSEHDVTVPNALSEDLDLFCGSEPNYIEAGLNYSVVLTKAGEVFTWGGGEFGRIGYLDEKVQPVPR